MSINNTTTPATTIPRQKYFPIEVYCAGMLPNTTYDLYLDGNLWNNYCKPYGGNLGAPLTSGSNGKLIIQMHVKVSYVQNYLAKPTLPNNSITFKNHTITLIDPFNNSSTQTLSILVRAGS